MNQDLTPKQQTSEAIRQAETILIVTGQHPNIDQVASTMALATVLRKFGKKVSAIISDPLPQQVGFLDASMIDKSLGGLRDFILRVDESRAAADSLRWEREGGKLNVYLTPNHGGFSSSDVAFDYGDYHYDLAIVLGVPTRARIDRVYADNQSLFDRLPIVNFDFHRSNESYGAINLIEPNASSLAEMLVALAESLQNGIVDEPIATALLTGLMASTDRFTAAHTTAKSLTVAAQLMAGGAKQPNIVRALFRDSRAAQTQERRDNERSDARPQQPRQQTVTQPIESTPVLAAAPEVVPVISETPAPVLTPAPVFEAPVAEPVTLPQPIAPSDDPIIEPSHIEAMLVPDDQLPMADFAAAAEMFQTASSELDQA